MTGVEDVWHGVGVGVCGVGDEVLSVGEVAGDKLGDRSLAKKFQKLTTETINFNGIFSSFYDALKEAKKETIPLFLKLTWNAPCPPSSPPAFSGRSRRRRRCLK